MQAHSGVTAINALASRTVGFYFFAVVAAGRYAAGALGLDIADVLRVTAALLLGVSVFLKPIDLSFVFRWERRQGRAVELASTRATDLLSLAALGLFVIGFALARWR